MTARPFPLADPVELGTVTARIGSPVPTNQSQMIVTATVCNKTGSTAAVDVWIVPDNATPDADNRMLDSYSVSANDTAYLPLSGLTMSAGYTLHARADTTNALTLFVSVWKVTV